MPLPMPPGLPHCDGHAVFRHAAVDTETALGAPQSFVHVSTVLPW
jgi:hypothetical protein